MIAKSAEETQKIAKNFARKILKETKGRKEALVFALRGDLGGGKTTFLQGFAKGLGVKEKITSPTFNIFKKFVLYRVKDKWFYHFDCYRIEKPEEIKALGFDEIISDSQNIVAIEWAERIKDILPKGTKWISFKFIDETARSIDIL